ncbi:MAG: glutamine--fructose-6-phosphate transaminase (isomerizing) [Opitutales bacterium]
MCGIVGYTGKHKAGAILVEGLKRLEYRGYDSAGVALLQDDAFSVFKKTGRVANVGTLVNKADSPARLGISHTRWATHGGVTDANAHPHISSDGRVALVHNGVIENYQSLRRMLENAGRSFQSETDTEVFCNLIAFNYAKEDLPEDPATRLVDAVRLSTHMVEGTFGIAVIATDCPETIVGARKGSPLCVGLGDGENMIASDVTAFLGRTQEVVYLDDGQIIRINPDSFDIIHAGTEEEIAPTISTIDWKIEEAELGHFSHFMEKEIYEQATALENAMRGRFSDDGSTAKFGGLNLDSYQWRQTDRLLFCACGTAWHACLSAKYMIERFARIPVEVEYASEFRYRNMPMQKDTVVFVVSQSGETIDTLEALREAKRKGFRVLGVTNGVGSTIARETDGGVYQHSGPEIGVASTKAFTGQLLIGAMLALYFGRMRDLSYSDGREMVQAFRSLPDLVGRCLDQADTIRDIAHAYSDYQDMLFLGRLNMFPIALEGALKLKEISYIHAEGYPAAEMKHGPIALISEACPSVVIAPHGETLPKILSSIQEIRARQGRVIAVTSAGSDFPADAADAIIPIPRAHDCVMPILATIPLQLLAYHIACKRGCDVDKPRNLAKSVTVE